MRLLRLKKENSAFGVDFRKLREIANKALDEIDKVPEAKKE